MKIRLNMNEMYKTPPKDVITSVKESIDQINRYSSQKDVEHLIKQLSNYVEVPTESIFLSPGSDLLIKEVMFLFSVNRKIIIADPTFIIINNSAQSTDSPLLKIKLNEPNFQIPLEAIIKELDTPSLVVFDNPNNPTGNIIITQNDVKRILGNENVILLLDEAYFEFSKVSYVDLISKFPNLAIVRTLSKSFGLAGSGIGYLIAGGLIMKKLQGLEIMLPYPSVIAGIKALQNQKYMEDYVKEIEAEKKRITGISSELGVTIYPSFTNFLLIKTRIQNISKKLEESGVLVHDVSNQLGSNYFRITIGSEKENNIFLESLQNIINNEKNLDF